MDHKSSERDQFEIKEQRAQDDIRRLQRELREAKDDLYEAQRKENDAAKKKHDLVSLIQELIWCNQLKLFIKQSNTSIYKNECHIMHFALVTILDEAIWLWWLISSKIIVYKYLLPWDALIKTMGARGDCSSAILLRGAAK